KQGRKKEELGFAAPLFPIVPILGFIFCFITCVSMVFDPSMRISFFGCLLFIAVCYASYYTFYHKKT
ncbi:MAG: S-methylmethionine permease, partial [Acinetobacter johnsonii]